MRKINLGDFVNFWRSKNKIARYFVVADQFANINFAEDLNKVRQKMG